ncbi:MAG: Fur family transcriptional regulator, ferric uptake regulator [Azoarcus sp.]|uniref:Ferric uptake regulation protein n=1 Tax=Aromatoleum tolulyticum TaxID=34027 RepID=A0A1N6Z6Q5_9RHOO|nr:Fur family transcriptional regulator [Aromatoleum tolulyticum]MCK9986988.1 Fur family transcriptional regulator, ferric uptake regulator [Azoarcus sp.]SIR22477.1 Fur family transcriptional regulator, ferric uptake regulator [Aromatoleum tolulyticum]
MPTPDVSPAAHLIAARGGRVTRARIAVLEILQDSPRSLNHDDVAARLAADGMPHDRVTLYRTLDWLVEQGLAHRIIGPDRARRFKAGGETRSQHAHFHCDRCGHVLCLESIRPEEQFALPAGYQPERAELVFHGTCADCGRQRGTKA